MKKSLHGRVHGKTIELDEDPGVAEGQEVEVQVTIVQPARKRGEGFLRTAGALADDPEWDTIMEQIYRERKGGVSWAGYCVELSTARLSRSPKIWACRTAKRWN